MNLDPDTFLNAISGATRLRILHLLRQSDERCVCELVKALESPQPSISKHLGVLRSHGIITGRRAGQWIHYKINPELPVWADSALASLMLGCQTRSPYREDLRRISRDDDLFDCA